MRMVRRTRPARIPPATGPSQLWGGYGVAEPVLILRGGPHADTYTGAKWGATVLKRSAIEGGVRRAVPGILSVIARTVEHPADRARAGPHEDRLGL